MPLPDDTSFLGLIVLRFLLKLSVSTETVNYLQFCKFKQGVPDPLDPPLRTVVLCAHQNIRQNVIKAYDVLSLIFCVENCISIF